MMTAISKISVIALTALFLISCSDNPAVDSPVKERAEPTVVNESVESSRVKAQVKAAPITETRSADSHTHGDATLALVLENGRVTAEFESPLFNLLGFEHAVETDVQKAALNKTEKLLARPEDLFVFNREANCIAAETAPVKLGLGGDEHADHKDHDDDHGDHHDDNHDDNHDTHKDVILQYQFNCKNADALKNVTVDLFKHFENLTTLDLVYLGPNTQKQMRLGAANNSASFTR